MLRIVKAGFLTILLSFLVAGYAFAEEAPTRILIISDLQITDDESSCGRFADALADMAMQDPYPDAIVINGDLTNDGQEEEWELYRSTLSDSGISIPIFATNGNHDIGRGEDAKPDDVYTQERDLFFQYTDFCGTGDDQLEYMDFSVAVNGYHVIALGNGNGNWHQEYTETQLQWFEDELLRCTREDAGKPVLVLTHEGIPNTVSGTLSEDSGQDWEF
ncbi:MAG: metallophosphoesterase [Oscillospiraceae bacterium]|nr:metallophosphoesterase [Oscillospiraceae bacterium]